jgi:hypothetical protein
MKKKLMPMLLMSRISLSHQWLKKSQKEMKLITLNQLPSLHRPQPT